MADEVAAVSKIENSVVISQTVSTSFVADFQHALK
jgi:hypothetical protein